MNQAWCCLNLIIQSSGVSNKINCHVQSPCNLFKEGIQSTASRTLYTLLLRVPTKDVAVVLTLTLSETKDEMPVCLVCAVCLEELKSTLEWRLFGENTRQNCYAAIIGVLY